MKRILVKFFASYLALVLAFVVLKPAFMLAHHSLYASAPARSLVAAMWHGLSMDLSMAAYFMVVPALIILVSCFVGGGRVMRRIECGYYIFSALVISLIAILDTALYSYWEFRLDTTPFYYFFSAPAMAMASVTTLQAIRGLVGWLVVAALFYALFYYVAVRKPMPSSAHTGRYGRAALSAFLMVALFVPMRGSVTVSTMNLSRAYFSSDMRLNHAAINPAFSLMYSLTHSDDFASKFRFFSEDEARGLAAPMTGPFEPSDSTAHLLSVERPDIYVIVLESFSSHLLPCMGGEPIAMRLDSIARSGLLFDNIYASSFRTDRALVAVLSGLPGQPDESLSKHTAKIEHLPSIASALAAEDYDCSYYYGGDPNFANKLAFLRASGFDKVIYDKDFPVADRISKWGAPDHAVFNRAFSDARRSGNGPHYRVVQTASSHEPFDVPYDNPRFPEGPKRAFAYADSCLGAFVDSLRMLPSWNRSLVVIVPDHYGAYPPRPLEPMTARHHVPLVLTGGALARTGERISRLGSQTDIAATLLTQLGIPSQQFRFSRDLLAPVDSLRPPFAFFSEPEQVMLIDADGEAIVRLADSEVQGSDPTGRRAKAYLQQLYNYIDSL
ncbi:MAG: sulfatase-like hydrolase/transferase [Muribaculaceae bacterium]|nr:sulfatase-like hydrolase/transferase [Muribaculaceae bacterium]